MRFRVQFCEQKPMKVESVPEATRSFLLSRGVYLFWGVRYSFPRFSALKACAELSHALALPINRGTVVEDEAEAVPRWLVLSEYLRG